MIGGGLAAVLYWREERWSNRDSAELWLGQRGFEPQHVVSFWDKTLYSQCLSSPRCIEGY